MAVIKPNRPKYLISIVIILGEKKGISNRTSNKISKQDMQGMHKNYTS